MPEEKIKMVDIGVGLVPLDGIASVQLTQEASLVNLWGFQRKVK